MPGPDDATADDVAAAKVVVGGGQRALMFPRILAVAHEYIVMWPTIIIIIIMLFPEQNGTDSVSIQMMTTTTSWGDSLPMSHHLSSAPASPLCDGPCSVGFHVIPSLRRRRPFPSLRSRAELNSRPCQIKPRIVHNNNSRYRNVKWTDVLVHSTCRIACRGHQ